MKILHVFNELKYSGAEIMYVSFADAFKEMDCKLYVLNTSYNLGEYSCFFKDFGYKVLHWYYKNRKIKFSINFAYKLIKFLKTENIDVVHVHRTDMFWMISFCAWIVGCKSVYTFHGIFPSNWYSYPLHIIERFTAKRFFNCVFQSISDSVQNHEKKFFFNKTIKVYNWYNCNKFFPVTDNEKNTIRNELNIRKDTLVIISIGGCNHIKQHSEIINALPLLVEYNSNTLYLHLGSGPDLQNEIELAEKLNVSKYIRFVENTTEVRKFLICSDIYLMTSKHEGISITTLEAMACKIPAILYNVPGLKDFNIDSQCSIFIDENYKLLANSIKNLHQNTVLQQTIVNNAYNLVNKKYHMANNVKEIYKLYLK